jgi:hypothetical protein
MWLLDKILGKKKEAEISESEKSKSSEDDPWSKLETLKERIERMGKTDSEVYRDLSAWQAQKFEGSRRIQIMEESADIIEETLNIDTLITRKEVLDEQLVWFKDLEEQKSPYHLTGGVEGKQKELDFLFNGLVLRIAQIVVETHKIKMEELETQRAKQSHRKKTFEIIKKCECVLIEYPDNFNDCKVGLEKCIQDIRALMLSQYEAMNKAKEKKHNIYKSIKNKKVALIEDQENCFDVIYTSNTPEILNKKNGSEK